MQRRNFSRLVGSATAWPLAAQARNSRRFTMEVYNRCLFRQLILGLTLSASVALMAALMSSPVIAQGTAEQRAACEDEGRWLCSNYIRDERSITRCMVRNREALSPRCRKIVGSGSKQQTQGAKRRR
jgi:hypothetical protein